MSAAGVQVAFFDDLMVEYAAGARAVFSADRKYRFSLQRWSCDRYGIDIPTFEAGRFLLFVMLNPSRAGGHEDDATIRRCRGFSTALGYDWFVVVNQYALIATNPRDLVRTAKAIGGSDNDDAIRYFAGHADRVICAWGANRLACGERSLKVVKLLLSSGKPLEALRTTKHGHPEHPLRLPAVCRPRPWSPT